MEDWGGGWGRGRGLIFLDVYENHLTFVQRCGVCTLNESFMFFLVLNVKNIN